MMGIRKINVISCQNTVGLSCSQRPRGVKKADCSALHIHCLTLKLVHIAHGISALLRAFFLPYARPSCMTHNRDNNGSQSNKRKNSKETRYKIARADHVLLPRQAIILYAPHCPIKTVGTPDKHYSEENINPERNLRRFLSYRSKYSLGIMLSFVVTSHHRQIFFHFQTPPCSNILVFLLEV